MQRTTGGSSLGAAEQLAAIVESSDDAIIGKTLDGTITSWNPAAERLYGYTAEEALGQPIELIVPDHRWGELADLMARLKRGERVEPFETVRRHKDGRLLPVRLSVSPINDSHGRTIGAASIGRDLSDRMEAEQALRNSQQQAVDILESISDGFYALDSEERVTYVNRRTEELWGRPRDELLGKRLWDVFPQAVGTETHEQHLRAAHEGRAIQYETFSPIVGRWIEVNIYPSARGLTVYFRDITERKQIEEAVQNAWRVRDEVLSAVSHDLRSPLTSIKAQAQRLARLVGKRDVPESQLLVDGLQMIDATATRMSRWIDELLDVTRLELGQELPLRLVPTDLVGLVRQAVEDHQQTTPVHSLHLEVRDAPLVGDFDAVRLRRVLDNLLSNAIKYSPAGGGICVRVGKQRDPDGVWAMIRVCDSGMGIPDADQPHIFERFHRAGNVAGRIAGTGLGLAGSRRIVQQHGGCIEVQSREGQGSTFTVRLPLPEPLHRLTRAS